MGRVVKTAAPAICLALLTAAGFWQMHRIRLVREAAATRQLAEHGDAKAEAELSTDYYYGRGVSQDYGQAFIWAQKGAKQGNARAEYDLGYLYQFGQGATQDDSQAFAWYRKSAGQGELRAQNALGVMYYYGRGVQEDRSLAVGWYSKAAEQGLPGAEYALGYCYQYGQGVPENRAEGDRWIRKAASQGYRRAQQALGLRGYGLSTPQIVIYAAMTAILVSLLMRAAPFAPAEAGEQRRLILAASLLGLGYIALRVYWAYGLFPSLIAVDAFAILKGFILGIAIAPLVLMISPKAAKPLLMLCLALGAVTFAAIMALALHHMGDGSSPITRFCSLSGMLVGNLAGALIALRSIHDPPQPDLAA